MGKRTAQKVIITDITSDSQVNSNFPYRWSPACLTFNNYFYLFLYLYITSITINNNTPHLKLPKNQNRRAALGWPAMKLLGAGGGRGLQLEPFCQHRSSYYSLLFFNAKLSFTVITCHHKLRLLPSLDNTKLSIKAFPCRYRASRNIPLQPNRFSQTSLYIE